MKFFSRTQSLPEVLRQLLAPGEHLLAWAQHNAGFVAVTDQRFISHSDAQVTSLLWHHILSAGWNDPQLSIVTAENDEPQILTWIFDEPGLVPTAVRDRVTATVLIDKAIDVPEVGRVRFVAHRTPDGVVWTSIAENSSAVSTVESQDRIRTALQNLRSTLGV